VGYAHRNDGNGKNAFASGGEIACNDPTTFQFIEEKDILTTELLS